MKRGPSRHGLGCPPKDLSRCRQLRRKRASNRPPAFHATRAPKRDAASVLGTQTMIRRTGLLRSPRRIVLAVCIIALFLWLSHPVERLRDRAYNVWLEPPYVQPLAEAVRRRPEPLLAREACEGFPAGVFDHVQIVVKVGAQDVHTKLAKQLATNTACVDDILLFSDYRETYGSHEIYDALEKLPREYWKDNPDREIYERQNRVRGVEQKSSEAERLDKYKYLPMMDMTYALRPGKDWYVFIEADTYVFWENLFRFLAHQEPRKAAYFGSPVWRSKLIEPTFAHGGSGIILSHLALKRLVRPPGDKHHAAGSSQFGINLKDTTSGDAAVADVLSHRGIRLQGYWPMLNGDKHHTVRFGDRWLKREQWCEPIITLHQINETDMQELWDWEMRRASTDPVVFEDMYRWMKPLIPGHRENWNILSDLETVRLPDPAAESPHTCEKTCREKRWCYQWSYFNGVCEHSPFIRVGREELPDKHGYMRTSGTLLDRVARFEKRAGRCKFAHWVHPHP